MIYVSQNQLLSFDLGAEMFLLIDFGTKLPKEATWLV